EEGLHGDATPVGLLRQEPLLDSGFEIPLALAIHLASQSIERQCGGLFEGRRANRDSVHPRHLALRGQSVLKLPCLWEGKLDHVALPAAAAPVRFRRLQGLLVQIVLDGSTRHLRGTRRPLWGNWRCKVLGTGGADGTNLLVRDRGYERRGPLGSGG